ncbi:MAG: ABC transporter ATP-binding protein [Theionarchaea archaeon]|nr:ABC transporter ATP-binding protein [Theionarchaea archaeon]
MTVISCKNLTKKFRDTLVLKDVTLDCDEGVFFGIYGEAGAGKTTLLKILSGILRPTSGSCHLFGVDVHKDHSGALQEVGCLVGEPAFYEYLTAEENLSYIASLLDEESDPVMESLDISYGDSYPSQLTIGMKYHLGIALALLGSPHLLLLDEPFSFLTDAQRSSLHTLFTGWVSEGMTVVFTTENQDEITELASEGAILSRGQIISQGPPSKLDFSPPEPEEVST